LIPSEGLDAGSGQVRKIFCESQVWGVRGSRGRKAIQSFRALRSTTAFGRAVTRYARAFFLGLRPRLI
jgi:hypothetical protein